MGLEDLDRERTPVARQKLKRLKYREYSKATRDVYDECMSLVRYEAEAVAAMAMVLAMLISVHVPEPWSWPLLGVPAAVFLWAIVLMVKGIRLVRKYLKMMRAEREAATFGTPAPVWPEPKKVMEYGRRARAAYNRWFYGWVAAWALILVSTIVTLAAAEGEKVTTTPSSARAVAVLMFLCLISSLVSATGWVQWRRLKRAEDRGEIAPEDLQDPDPAPLSPREVPDRVQGPAWNP